MIGVVLVNLVVVEVCVVRSAWSVADGSALSGLSAMTVVDLAAAVLIRQQRILNLLYRAAGRCSSRWPLWVRWSVSNVHHVGGIHAGAAIAGTGSMVAFAAVAVAARSRQPAGVTAATVMLSLVLAALLVTVSACAAPPVRARAHNVFEQSHRWGGWIAMAIFWVLTIHLAMLGRGGEAPIDAMIGDWHVWILTLVTASIASPWLRLRRVPVVVERPSAHVAIVQIDDRFRPTDSAAVGIARSPLREWHAFATVASPDRPGYRLVISRAGDWTARFIDDPPTHLWLRGVPVSAPMAQVSTLYERVVYVVTGSGIGPCLGQILADRVPARLVWSTRDPRPTYGDALVDEVEAAQPDAMIWDTTTHGKPDLLRLALDAYADFGAEAVFVVSNKATTLRLVSELDQLGIPAFGPIWDS